jgi:O-antigen/teichoic acid export membrane protein
MIIQLVRRIFKGEDRSSKIFNNIFKTFIFKGGNMLINLALVPMMINFVSVSDYGVWLTISSIIAWFGISDIGFGQGLRNKFAESLAKGDKELARSYVSTTYVSLSVFLILIWLFFFIFNDFLDWSIILNTDSSMREELSSVVLFVFTFFVLQFIFKLVSTVLTANQEPGKAAGFDFCANFFVLICIFVLIKLNIKSSLMTLALTTGLIQLFVYVLASFWFYSKELKDYRPSIAYFRLDSIRSLMGLGIKFFIVQISSIFVFQCTNLIIAQQLGANEVTVYNIAYKYFTIPMTVGLIITSPFWSAFTDAYVRKDYEWMKKVYKNIFYLLVGIIFVLLIFYFVSDLLYEFWIGNKVVIPKKISFLMLINIIASVSFSMFITIINGIGKLKVQLITSIVLSLLFIPLALFFSKIMGLEGILLANISVNIIYVVLVVIQSYKLINKKAIGIWNK